MAAKLVYTMLESLILSHRVPEDWRAQADVFGEIFTVFLIVGTLVGVVVVGYTLYNAYKARHGNGEEGDSFEPPVLGELPTGQQSEKSRKLFVSFGISAVIVISLVAYSYFLLLYVEQGPTEEIADSTATEMDVEVVGVQFAWQFNYPNGVQTFGELRVPKGRMIRLSVTSGDVWHNFGAPELRIKADSIPGQYSETWFLADEVGNYTVNCYELCGRGHADMTAEIIVMETGEFEEWYAEQSGEGASNGSSDGASNESGDPTDAGNATTGPNATASGRVGATGTVVSR